jgi:protein TIF31
LDIFPIVKAHLPGSKDARDLLESGSAYLTQGSVEPAYQLLQESLNLHHQVFGPMHVDTAHVYATLALTCYHAGETGQAVDFQQRAIIIFERVLGLDSHETAHAHMHQALFLLGASQQQQPASGGAASLSACKRHMARALYLFELIAGPNHPDSAAAHINAAMIEQESGRPAEGLKHVEMALERNQLALGPEHTQVALSHHTVAVAHALMGDFRNSVNHEKMAKSIYLAQLGNKHASVVRSHYWLEHFTLLAVKTQQTTNQMVAGKKGKRAEAAAAAATEQFRRAATPSTIIPPQMAGLATALTWVSLHSSTSVKGKVGHTPHTRCSTSSLFLPSAFRA